MEVRFSDGSVEQYADTALGGGRQGQIYAARDGKSVVKIYHPDFAGERDNIYRINNLIDRFNPTRQDAYWTQFFTWPEKRVVSPGVGYRMRYVPGMKTLSHYIFSKAYKRLPPEEKGWFIGRVAAAIKLITAADRLSRMGLCYPDFSDKNVMVDPFAGHMVLIDCDSLTVPTILPATIEGTSWFRAPEIIAKKTSTPTVITDRHAMAVLLYQWFLSRHPLDGDRPPLDSDPDKDDLLRYGENALYSEHPTDTLNHLKGGLDLTSAALGPELQKLFRIAFVDGLHQPDARPLPYQWQKGLQHTYDWIIPCASMYCDWRFFVADPSARLICPKCHEPVRNPQTVPLLYLQRYKGTKAPLKSDTHYIVGWPQRILHQWHTREDATPFYVDPHNKPDNAPCALFAYEQAKNQWYLQNLALADLRYRLPGDPADRWTPWPINSTLPLAQQMEILFSNHPASFRGLVEIRRV